MSKFERSIFPMPLSLTGGYKVAAVFSQFVPPDTLATLTNRKKRPLTIAPEHDPETLGDAVLDEEHLHIIVQKPETGKYCYLLALAFQLLTVSCSV